MNSVALVNLSKDSSLCARNSKAFIRTQPLSVTIVRNFEDRQIRLRYTKQSNYRLIIAIQTTKSNVFVYCGVQYYLVNLFYQSNAQLKKLYPCFLCFVEQKKNSVLGNFFSLFIKCGTMNFIENNYFMKLVKVKDLFTQN